MEKINRILLVDDSEATNAANIYYINKGNYAENIDCVLNGKKALEYLTTKNAQDEYPNPDLIFLDINMPVMGGIEFLENYEKLDDECKAKAVIIMLTTSLDENEKRKAENYEISSYCIKPLSEQKLIEIFTDYHSRNNHG